MPMAIRSAAKIVPDIGAVEDHPAGFGIDPIRIDGRQSLRRNQKDNELVLIEIDGIPKDNGRGNAALPQLVERGGNGVTPSRLGHLDKETKRGCGLLDRRQL